MNGKERGARSDRESSERESRIEKEARLGTSDVDPDDFL
jgi:hypothetical protein